MVAGASDRDLNQSGVEILALLPRLSAVAAPPFPLPVQLQVCLVNRPGPASALRRHGRSLPLPIFPGGN